MEGIMTQLSVARSDRVFDLATSLEETKGSVGSVAHLLHGLAAPAAPITGDDHDAILYLISQLFDIHRTLEKSTDLAYALWRETKAAAA
jgi:hypothetical protein